MTAYKLTRSAQATLVDIYVHTHNAWGLKQADAYLDGLYECFGDILEKRLLWRPIPAEFEVDGYFTRYQRHFIYWRELADNTIFITAILHTSMFQHDRLRRVFGEDDELQD